MAITRRQFLGTSAAAVVAAGTMVKGRVWGANGRINIACIGINGRGGSHIGAFAGKSDTQVVALCDVDKKVLADRAAEVRKRQGGEVKTYTDVRELLADPGIDAVTIASPNHWHSLMAIWALENGKHVYVEKPLSHNVWEGRQLVNAAQKYGKVVMHGTQRRSEPAWLRAVQAMRDGIIGDVYMARGLCFKPRGPIGFGQPMPPPGTLDWNLWQGPAEEREYIDYADKSGSQGTYVHYNWHWFWPYGNGDVGNQGVHQMDVAVWGLNAGVPVKVHSCGGRFGYEDQAETPNTLVTTFSYEDGRMLVFEVRGLATNTEEDSRIGNLFYGSGGYFAEADNAKNSFRFHDTQGKEIPLPEMQVDTKGCWANFIRAIQSGKPEDNYAPVLEGHISSVHCHLANVAYRVGRSIAFDPKTETCPGDDEANALLTRNYRAPFVVPKVDA